MVIQYRVSRAPAIMHIVLAPREQRCTGIAGAMTHNHVRGAPPMVASGSRSIEYLLSGRAGGAEPRSQLHACHRLPSFPALDSDNTSPVHTHTASIPSPTAPTTPPAHALVALDEHDWHARNLADAAPQVAVARRHDVAAVLLHSLADAVVRVGARVRAGQALHAGVLQGRRAGGAAGSCTAVLVASRAPLSLAPPPALPHAHGMCDSKLESALAHLGNLERHAVLLPQLLQLGHHAVGDHGGALGVQAVHHALREGGRAGGQEASTCRHGGAPSSVGTVGVIFLAAWYRFAHSTCQQQEQRCHPTAGYEPGRQAAAAEAALTGAGWRRLQASAAP